MRRIDPVLDISACRSNGRGPQMDVSVFTFRIRRKIVSLLRDTGPFSPHRLFQLKILMRSLSVFLPKFLKTNVKNFLCVCTLECHFSWVLIKNTFLN